MNLLQELYDVHKRDNVIFTDIGMDINYIFNRIESGHITSQELKNKLDVLISQGLVIETVISDLSSMRAYYRLTTPDEIIRFKLRSKNEPIT
jgi:hypothetical protein